MYPSRGERIGFRRVMPYVAGQTASFYLVDDDIVSDRD